MGTGKIARERGWYIATPENFLVRRPHLIPSAIAAVMLLAALGKCPYAYYQLMRWVVCAAAVFVAYKAWKFKRPWVVWTFGFVAFLFNPLVPFHINRNTWQVVDLLAAGLFVAGIAALHKPAPPNADARQVDTSDKLGREFESRHIRTEFSNSFGMGYMRVFRWLLLVPGAVLALMLGSLAGGIVFSIFGIQSLTDAGSALLGSFALAVVAGLIAPSKRRKTTLVFSCIIFFLALLYLALLLYALSVATNIEEFSDLRLDRILIPVAQILGALGALCAIVLVGRKLERRSMTELNCPECGNPLEVPDEETSSAPKCLKCGAVAKKSDSLVSYAAVEPSSKDRRNTCEFPPKDSWTAAIQPIVSSVVMFVVMYLGGLALHVWTCFLFYHRWGPFWGIAAFFSPPLPEIFAVFACFWWHIWYYILAIALWLVSLGAAGFMEKAPAFRYRLALFFGWICLVGVLSVSFGQYAWRYSLRPTSRTETAQAQLEDCAVAILASLHASDSDDPSALASLVTAKKELKDMIQGYDKASLDELCQIVDESLRFERSLQNDLLAYMEELVRTGNTSKFKIGDRTRQELDKLPNKLRTLYRTNYIEAGEDEITKQVGENASIMAEKSVDIMGPIYKRFAHTWKIYGQTYSEVLGRPMPRSAD